MPSKLAARSSTIISISTFHISKSHEYVPGFSPASESLVRCTGVMGLAGLVSALRDQEDLCPEPFPALLACPSKILFPAFRSVNFCGDVEYGESGE